MVTMMCQAIGNAGDNANGRQMPVHYSWRAGNVVSISSPVGTQLPQAVGAAMAFAYRGERRTVGTWVGDGTAAQGDFHHALNFASVFRPPCVLHVVDNQWAISTHRNLSTGGATFAARADAYRLPGLRVDGNDFLAVHAAEAWAIERARRGGGPTLIELVTYRTRCTFDERRSIAVSAGERSRSLAGWRPDRTAQAAFDQDWRMVRSSRTAVSSTALETEVAATFQQAESFGTWSQGLGHAAEALFEDVYAAVPAHLQSQRDELCGNVPAQRRKSRRFCRLKRRVNGRCSGEQSHPSACCFTREVSDHAHDEHDSGDSVGARGDARARSERMRVWRGRGLLRRRVSSDARACSSDSARSACSIRRSRKAESSRSRSAWASTACGRCRRFSFRTICTRRSIKSSTSWRSFATAAAANGRRR